MMTSRSMAATLFKKELAETASMMTRDGNTKRSQVVFTERQIIWLDGWHPFRA
jgi:hypothetical protein